VSGHYRVNGHTPVITGKVQVRVTDPTVQNFDLDVFWKGLSSIDTHLLEVSLGRLCAIGFKGIGFHMKMVVCFGSLS
jgi:hypothetical protein